MLMAIYELFNLRFCVQVISEKTLCSKDFTSNLSDILCANNCNYI